MTCYRATPCIRLRGLRRAGVAACRHVDHPLQRYYTISFPQVPRLSCVSPYSDAYVANTLWMNERINRDMHIASPGWRSWRTLRYHDNRLRCPTPCCHCHTREVPAHPRMTMNDMRPDSWAFPSPFATSNNRREGRSRKRVPWGTMDASRFWSRESATEYSCPQEAE